MNEVSKGEKPLKLFEWYEYVSVLLFASGGSIFAP